MRVVDRALGITRLLSSVLHSSRPHCGWGVLSVSDIKSWTQHASPAPFDYRYRLIRRRWQIVSHNTACYSQVKSHCTGTVWSVCARTRRASPFTAARPARSAFCSSAWAPPSPTTAACSLRRATCSSSPPSTGTLTCHAMAALQKFCNVFAPSHSVPALTEVYGHINAVTIVISSSCSAGSSSRSYQQQLSPHCSSVARSSSASSTRARQPSITSSLTSPWSFTRRDLGFYIVCCLVALMRRTSTCLICF